MIINSGTTILVLAPHTDDGELGLGGTIHKYSKMGCTIHYIAFSSAQESIPEGFNKDTTKKECRKATQILGILPDNIEILDYKVRNFDKERQSILDYMIYLRKEIKPDLIFTPSSDDVHQDHHVINVESVRAFKNYNLLGYSSIWNEFCFSSDLLISLSEQDVQAKYNALLEYETQENRPYMSKEFIYGLCKSRGVQVNTQYAEAFEVIRCVIR